MGSLVKDSQKKAKPTLKSLLSENQVITGKELIERHKEAEKQKALLKDAIDFEERNRRKRSS